MSETEHRVSFGEIFAALTGGDADLAKQIHAAIEVDYCENL